MTKTTETENPHTRHVLVTECWPADCIEGECEHRDEWGEPEDMSVCPPTPMEVCIDHMIERGLGGDPRRWDDAPLDEWPCAVVAPTEVEQTAEENSTVDEPAAWFRGAR